MSVHTDSTHNDGPDADLVEYVVLNLPDGDALAAVVDTVQHLVDSGAISVLDAVLLTRSTGGAPVAVLGVEDNSRLAALRTIADRRLRLSDHDVALAAATVEPAAAVLLLLLEDCWAQGLADAARAAGGRLSTGERVARERVLAGLARSAVGPEYLAAADHPGPASAKGDLLRRGPQPLHGDNGFQVDAAAQVARMATLLEQGILTVEQYEIQRRRAIRD